LMRAHVANRQSPAPSAGARRYGQTMRRARRCGCHGQTAFLKHGRLGRGWRLERQHIGDRTPRVLLRKCVIAFRQETAV
jgi:hypothetical protein